MERGHEEAVELHRLNGDLLEEEPRLERHVDFRSRVQVPHADVMAPLVGVRDLQLEARLDSEGGGDLGLRGVALLFRGEAQTDLAAGEIVVKQERLERALRCDAGFLGRPPRAPHLVGRRGLEREDLPFDRDPRGVEDARAGAEESLRVRRHLPREGPLERGAHRLEARPLEMPRAVDLRAAGDRAVDRVLRRQERYAAVHRVPDRLDEVPLVREGRRVAVDARRAH